MTFTNEQIEKAKAVKSFEELIALAKEEGIELSEEKAAAIFKTINEAEVELSIEELENVAGGKDEKTTAQCSPCQTENDINAINGRWA